MNFFIPGQGIIFFNNSNTVHELRFCLGNEDGSQCLEVIFTEQMVQVNPVMTDTTTPWYDSNRMIGMDIGETAPIYWFSLDAPRRIIYAGTGDSPDSANVLYKYSVDSYWADRIAKISWVKDTNKVSYMNLLRIEAEPFRPEIDENSCSDSGGSMDDVGVTSSRGISTLFGAPRRRRRRVPRGKHFLSGHIDEIITKEYDKFVVSTTISS